MSEIIAKLKQNKWFAGFSDHLWGCLENDLKDFELELKERREFGHADYCVTCGSCGEDGCCSPSKCVMVKCLHGEGNKNSYTDLLEENERLRQEVISLDNQLQSLADSRKLLNTEMAEDFLATISKK
jgi:hypothetical protein